MRRISVPSHAAKHVSHAMSPLIQGCCKSSCTVGRFSESRMKHLRIKSRQPGVASSSGISVGIPVADAIIMMAAGALVLQGHGGRPVSISATVHPTDHTSAL